MIFYIFNAKSLNSTLQYALETHPNFPDEYLHIFKALLTVFNLLFQSFFCLYLVYRKKYQFLMVPGAIVLQCTFSIVTQFICQFAQPKVLMFYSTLVEASMDLLTSASILVIPYMGKLEEQYRPFLNLSILSFSLGFPLLSMFHHEIIRMDFPIISLTSCWIYDKGLFRLQYLIPLLAIFSNLKTMALPNIFSQLFKLTTLIFLEISEISDFSIFPMFQFATLIVFNCISPIPDLIFSIFNFQKIKNSKNEPEIVNVERISST